jgi:hypothetical protein
MLSKRTVELTNGWLLVLVFGWCSLLGGAAESAYSATTAQHASGAPDGSSGQVSSAPHWRTLTIHQAWREAKKGAYGVAKHAADGDPAFTSSVQPQSACVRHSQYVIDCPFSYTLGGSGSNEEEEVCLDVAKITEVAEQRFHFSASNPSCHLVNNEGGNVF